MENFQRRKDFDNNKSTKKVSRFKVSILIPQKIVQNSRYGLQQQSSRWRIFTNPVFVSVIVAFRNTIAWDGQYGYRGVKYTFTFLDSIRSEVFLLFASLEFLVLRLSTAGHWGALGDSITDQVWVEALGRRGTVEIVLVFTGSTAISRF